MNEMRWALPAAAEFVHKTRDVVGETLHGWGLPHLISDAQLIVSELYTNALKHGEPNIDLYLGDLGQVLYGSVTDCGRRRPRLRAVNDWTENGRGLRLVAAYSLRWGVADLDGKRKAVWFLLRARSGG